MAQMTFDEMCTFVRTHADADITDAPVGNLTVYARMAYTDILRRQNAWPHLEVNYTFSSAAGTQTYALTSFTGTDMDYVSSVQDVSTGDRLFPIQQADADQIWNAQSQGTPAAFTILNQSIVLWPKPTSIKSYAVRGQRTEAVWPAGAGSYPDLPSALHETICLYMLAYFFLGQEDMQMSGQYMERYERSAQTLVGAEGTKRHGVRPAVMGANNRRFWTGAFVNRVKQWVE